MMSARGVDIESVQAVFIAHKHCEHFQGLRGLRKYENIKFYANRKTAEILEANFDFEITWEKFDQTRQQPHRAYTSSACCKKYH